MVFENELKAKTMEYLDTLDAFETANPELHELKDAAFSAAYKLLKKLIAKGGK